MNSGNEKNAYFSPSLNFEIDYDKLAEAMVKALKSAENDSGKNAKANKKFRNSFFRNLNGAFYGLLGLFSILVIVSIWVRYVNHNDLTLTVCIVLSALCCYFTVVSFLCCYESMRDEYEQTISMLNTNITLIALIVAIVALYYSVGK